MSHHCKRFEGKSVIITAATAGIGLGIAQRLGEEGAKLTICSRKQVHWTSAALCLQASIMRGIYILVSPAQCYTNSGAHPSENDENESVLPTGQRR